MNWLFNYFDDNYDIHLCIAKMSSWLITGF